jgi:phosphate transport system permease protein
MTDHSSLWQSPEMSRKLAKRYASERRFKWVGVVAIVLSLSFLAFLIFTMVANGASGIDLAFLTNSDSTDPATAGVWGAFKGSLLTMGVTLALSFPMGVLAAVYLEIDPITMHAVNIEQSLTPPLVRERRVT